MLRGTAGDRSRRQRLRRKLAQPARAGAKGFGLYDVDCFMDLGQIHPKGSAEEKIKA